MIKLNNKTYYYMYVDNNDAYISDIAPVKENNEYQHPELGYNCYSSFYVDCSDIKLETFYSPKA